MELDKSFPLVEGAIEAEQAGENPTPNRSCLNCNTALVDIYCPHCGQKNIPPRQTFGDLIINFISSFWSFESKFFSSLKSIMLKPGVMARHYTEGKRERYFHPARMYVFISFIYFLLISILPDENLSKPDNTNSTNVNWNYDKTIGEFDDFAQYDSAQRALPAEQRDGGLKRMIYKRISEVNEKYRNNGTGFSTDFGENFIANIPRIFFVLLPIFALLLKLLYFRQDFFYSEHLIFSVYYYNFFFLAGSLYMLVDLIPVVEYLTWGMTLWILLYMPIGMKKMYGQPWGKTILKYCTFIFLFSFCILLGLATNALITFLII